MPLPLLRYLKLQPIDSSGSDESSRELDHYEEDEEIDLSQDEDGDTLIQEWNEISDAMHDDAPVDE